MQQSDQMIVNKTRILAVAERLRVIRVIDYFAKSFKVIRNDTLE